MRRLLTKKPRKLFPRRSASKGPLSQAPCIFHSFVTVSTFNPSVREKQGQRLRDSQQWWTHLSILPGLSLHNRRKRPILVCQIGKPLCQCLSPSGNRAGWNENQRPTFTTKTWDSWENQLKPLWDEGPWERDTLPSMMMSPQNTESVSCCHVAIFVLARSRADENICPPPFVIIKEKSSKSFLPSPGSPCLVSKSTQHKNG